MQDRFFKPDHERGPFTSIKTFHDWMFATATRQHPQDDNDEIQHLNHPHMLRDLLPDTAIGIYFTHGDLTLGNIMVSGTPGSFDIAGILDWEQAGWYPEYWEYCKMHFAAGLDHEWSENNWPDEILEPHEDAYFAFSQYTLWRGG